MKPKEVLTEITSIGKFRPRAFCPGRKGHSSRESTTEISHNAEGLRVLTAKNTRLQRSIDSLEFDVKMLEDSIKRHNKYMKILERDHNEQLRLIQQQIENRKIQIGKIDNSQEAPTVNQLLALVRQIQVQGMASKRRAENCLREQEANIVLSSERLLRFHDHLSPDANEQTDALRSLHARLEAGVYKTAAIESQLRSLTTYNSNLEKKLEELSAESESHQVERQELQMAIVDRKEELRIELSKHSEELGKFRWRVEDYRRNKFKG